MFVVGYLGDWRPPAAVLFERDCLLRDLTPSREAGKNVTGSLASRTSAGGGLGIEFERGGGLVPSTGNTAHCLNAGGMGRQDYETETLISHTLTRRYDSSSNGTEGGLPIVPVSFDCKVSGRNCFGVGEIASTLRSMGHSNSHQNGGGHQAVAIPILEVGARSNKPIPINTQLGLRGPETSNSVREGLGIGNAGDPMFTLQAAHQHAVACFDARQITSPQNRSAVSDGAPAGTLHQDGLSVITPVAVRRLTPRECERLQGFPDDYTLLPHGPKRKKILADEYAYLRSTYPDITATEAKRLAADGPRYKALGNSMAVPCMRWLGQRIDSVSKIIAG